MPTPAGTLQHLLVIANPGALTPYDPESTALPGEEHVYFTSRRRADHPWIAQAGEGPNARPDISIGGQRLELPLGRSIDGECQVRIVDVPAPISAVACDIDAVLVPEGHADLHLDGTAFSSGKWTIETDHVLTEPPASNWGANASGPLLNTFALFGWLPFGGPWVRSTWITATFDGTEAGGAGWTPGQKVGFRFRVNWTLDTGGGNVFVEVNGVRVSGPTPLFNFWDIPTDPLNNQVDLTVYAVVDDAGEVVVKLGAENMFPSFNLQVQFTDMEIVECEDVVVAVDSERYMTANLADEAARHHLLGRPYYLKASTDGGATFDEMVYAGFLQQATMERSLTFLLTGSDSGRGRRVSRAWAGLNPVEDFIPA